MRWQEAASLSSRGTAYRWFEGPHNQWKNHQIARFLNGDIFCNSCGTDKCSFCLPEIIEGYLDWRPV